MIFQRIDYVNLAATLNSQGRYEEALNACEMGLRVNPALASLHANRARALVALEREREAFAACEAALTLDPRSAEAYIWRAFTHEACGSHSEALQDARAALDIAPKSEAAHCTLATLLLWHGEYREGLREQEWHWRREAEHFVTRFGSQPWEGARAPRSRLLIVHEQGAGDFIHGARYIRLLRERVGRTIVEVPAELADVLRSVAGIDEIVIKGTPVDTASFDSYVRLTSLARVAGSEPETLPRDVPYVQPDLARVAVWDERLSRGRLRVGIVWAGNPEHTDDRNRSIDLAVFAGLANVAGVAWFSLQKGAHEGDHAPGGLALERLGPYFESYADTGAAIAALDLVITVDTSVGHLAGAIGKPVWLLLPRWPDWRWMLDRSDTPWYPTMRLFRRGRGEGWEAVVERTASALRALASA
jgi:hypothetical protein